MNRRTKIFVTAILIGFPLLIAGVFYGDYRARTSHWATKAGCAEITGVALPPAIAILDYKVESFMSMADRPNHWWLLRSATGFAEISIRTEHFTLGDAKYIRNFRDAWPTLPPELGNLQVGSVIMGIGSGQETLFISEDKTYALLNAFSN